MKNVIITGATGFIGNRLIEELTKNEVQVHAIVRDLSKTKKYSTSLVRYYECEIKDIDSLKELFSNNIDAFYHLAWEGSTGPKRADHKVQINNIENTLKCAEFSKTVHCKKFIGIGTITENLLEQSLILNNVSENLMYGMAKYSAFIMTNLLCKKLNISFIWAQLSNVYGKENQTGNILGYTISKLQNDELAEFSSAETYYDFIAVEDVVYALRLLGEKTTNRTKYFIGSGSPKILREYLLDIGKILKKEQLIGIGKKPNDGLVYELEWFSIKDLEKDVGFKVTKNFQENIKAMIHNEI
jgi:nucleoside-diphosphate-sugar epimerase